jgi:argininosuccinate lyase
MPKTGQRRVKSWAGRFHGRTHPAVERFTASVHFDKRLAPYDVQGSMAHARMLAKCGILAKGEAEAILRGLRAILREVERGTFPWDPALEDVHMNIEARLLRKIGPVGGKLHTARSTCASTCGTRPGGCGSRCGSSRRCSSRPPGPSWR